MRDGMIYSLSSPIPIGREGENEAREVAIDICQLVRKWPGLTPQLLAKRPGEADPYPCRTRVEDGVLIWEITDSDTAIPGMGECVIHMVGDGGVIGKSRIARTVIKADIAGAMQETPPSAYTPWIDEVLAAGAAAENAAEQVPQTIEAALTEAKASGEFDGADGADGYSPTVNLERVEGGVKITAVNKDGEESETVFDGKDGKAADTFVVLNNAGEALSATPEAIDAAAADGKAIFLEKDGVTYTYAGKVASTLDSSVRVHAFHGAFERRNGRDFLKEVQFKPSGTETIIRFAPILTPNPNKLILTGAVNASYDGSAAVTVRIPADGGGLDEEALFDTLNRWGVIESLQDGDGAYIADADGAVITY